MYRARVEQKLAFVSNLWVVEHPVIEMLGTRLSEFGFGVFACSVVS